MIYYNGTRQIVMIQQLWYLFFHFLTFIINRILVFITVRKYTKFILFLSRSDIFENRRNDEILLLCNYVYMNLT